MKYFLFILLIFISVASKTQDVRFKHIGKESGLSQSRVNCILQDRDGFLWFGTDDGLNRYDGRNFTVFKNNVSLSKSISDNWINCLYEDKDGRIWIGTAEGGLNVYDKISNTFKHYLKNNTNFSISSDFVTSIVPKDETHIWVGTNDGLNLMDVQTGKFVRFKDEDVHADLSKTIPNDNIRVLWMDKSGVLWIGTEKNGLISYESKTGKFKSWLITREDKTPEVEYSERVRTVFEDRKNRLWIGFQGAGVAVLDRKTGEFDYMFSNDSDKRSNLASNVVQHIFEDHEGYIWIATADGISLYDDDGKSFKTYRKIDDDVFSLKENRIRFMMEDRAHSVWCGTESSGISVFHRSLGKFNHIFSKSPEDFAPSSNTIFAFEEGWNNDIWIATIGGGITRMNFESQKINHYTRKKNLTHDNILCLEKTGNQLYFGSWGGGLGALNLETEKFQTPKIMSDGSGLSNNTIIDIEKDEKGNLWLATFNGLNYYDKKKDTFYTYSKANGYPFSVIYSVKLIGDDLWIGTRGDGLVKMNVKTRKTETFRKNPDDKNSLADNTVHSIFYLKNELWIATKNGLSRYNFQSKFFQNYFESDGLSSNFILGILVDKAGNLWLSTNNGISRFNPDHKNEKRFTTRTYYAIDGLQSDEFNQNAFFKSSKGEVFFGGVNGFNHFVPEKIVDNSYVPPVFITSFKIFGKETEFDTSIFYTRHIELSYRENFISFEFAALDYLLPEKNLYSYKMEGLEDNWSEPSTRNYISYSDLAGGEYTFMVRASNNDGVWNDTGIRIHVVVIPPFYKTKWFYSLCAFLVFLLVFVFIRVRIAGINREKKVLEEKVNERTRELAEKNRDIMSSIEYAQRIQLAILPERKVIFEHFPDAFIFYQPKDIVSGDFYWFGVVDKKKIIAAVDCTGHGVPGAFMSMIGHNLLNQIILENKITDPATILTELNKHVKTALKQENKGQDSRDGMDIALCVIDEVHDEIQYAGAFRPLYIVRNNSLEKIEGDKTPIGGAIIENPVFNTHKRKLKTGDSIFIHSDGIVDQFGGPKAKKFMGKNLQSILVENSGLHMQELKSLIMDRFYDWKGDIEQVDDVLIIGIRYSKVNYSE